MENLWEIIAKARGVELDEEFLYSLGNFEYKYRISERGLEYYDNDGGRWTFSECSSEFIKGIGKIEKIPFTPKVGDEYWTYSNGIKPCIGKCIWNNICYDKERKLLRIVFRTRHGAKIYLETWEKRLEGEQ